MQCKWVVWSSLHYQCRINHWRCFCSDPNYKLHANIQCNLNRIKSLQIEIDPERKWIHTHRRIRIFCRSSIWKRWFFLKRIALFTVEQIAFIQMLPFWFLFNFILVLFDNMQQVAMNILQARIEALSGSMTGLTDGKKYTRKKKKQKQKQKQKKK